MTGSSFKSPVVKDARVKIKLSSDRMTASVVGYLPPEEDGAVLDLESLKAQIAAAGVTAAPEPAALEEVLDYIRAGRPFTGGVVVAEGKPPVNGEDGRLELFVDTEMSTGAVLEDGRIDYRNRGLVKSAIEGDLLGRIFPPKEGEPGMDVTGGSVPARKGRPAAFTPGSNVRVAENGVDIVASAGGMLRRGGNKLSVIEALVISGDVDFSTGDLLMSEGAVRIRGTVRSGFKVQAAESVLVEQSVEDAQIIAGGGVTVKGGILKGSILCSGAAAFKYARNATVAADEAVIIENSAFNCNITSKDKVLLVGKKGLVRGGTIRAERGVEAVEIGSPSSAGTHIVIGLAHEIYASLLLKKEKLEDELFRFTHKYGELDLEGIANRFGDASEPKVENALKNMARHKQLLRLIAEEKKKMQLASSATLIVRKIVHPGTIVTIAGKTLTLSHAVMLSRFYFDQDADNIRWAPLSQKT